MKLKKLIVSGFKSFADRTEFEFDDGISAVVGPNGCGKSNIVDAIKWVMGEQSAKSLRGGEMADVIFNGSSARKASGQARVTLQFDNHDGVLQPVAGGEIEPGPTVSVTRRLYRSGQSEYLINNTPCRLRDIKEMFLDTGVGSSAYSIIEQGRIGQFLQATQEERRAFFDEAAGISRYKARKREALRKLDRVEQNLLRLTDILEEVEKRLRSIKYQAGKARNYQAYSERLRELRMLHFLSRFHVLREQRKSRQGDLDTAGDNLATVQTRIGQLESAQSSAEVESVQLERASRDAQARLASLDTQITALQQRQEDQATRLEEWKQQILSGSSRGEELEARIEAAETELHERRQQLDEVLRETDELHQQAQAMHQEHASAQLAVSHLQARLEDERNGVAELLRRTQELHNTAHATGLKRQSLHGEKERTSGMVEELAGKLESLFEEHATLKARQGDADAVLEDSRQKLEDVKQSASELNDRERTINEELAESRETRSGLLGRMHTLEEMQKRHEGVAEGAKRVLAARQQGKLPAVRGMLSDFLETDSRHAPLVEAALAGADQRLLVSHFAQMEAMAGELRDVLGDGGRVELSVLDSVAPGSEPDAFHCPLVHGCLLDSVRYEAWLEPLMRKLLGQTYLVQSLADARVAAESAPSGSRFVTRRGDVLEADGRIRIGGPARAEGLISRQSRLRELAGQTETLQRQIQSLETQSRSTHDQRQALEERIQQLRTAIYEANYERDECTKRLADVESQIEDLKRRQPRLAQDLADIEQQIESAVRQEHETKEKAEELERLKTQRDEQVGQIQTQLAGAEERREELTGQLTDMKVTHAAAEQKAFALREGVSSRSQRLEEMRSELQEIRNNIEENRRRQQQTREDMDRAATQVEDLYAQRSSAEEDVREVQESRDGLTERLEEIRTQIRERREAEQTAAKAVNDLRVQIGELDAHISDIIQRSSEEMGMNIAEMYVEYEHDNERDWDAVAAEIEELRGKIDRLGNVNLDAISEQEGLEERQEFLAGQIQDVQASQRQLEELIRRINRESRERFEETFTAVRENFQVLFRKLFGGGKADIFLSDPEDILESGIEIVARPPGKELRSITLLSGGEKTMAALALIFSFFQARPSPFCLLDEVDAALDEANNERYNTLLEEFSAHSQFIMITHSKRTMSIANVLYGVTMQEAGVSRQINVRFEEASEMAEDFEPAGA